MSIVTRVFKDETGITAASDSGDVMIMSNSDPAYHSVAAYLFDDGGRDYAHLASLAQAGKARIRSLADAAQAVVDGDGGSAYRIQHGDPVSRVILEAAVRVTRQGGDPAPVAAFLSRLDRNPSPESRSQLFAWLKAEGLALTQDGLIVGYKGVTDDFHSVHCGQEPVTITPQGGEPEVHVGRLPYPVGAEVVMPRRLVNTSRSTGCSVGLHVGTFDYAGSWGSKTLLVLVDPADVVSVPDDCSHHKMRVCRFIAAREHTSEDRVPGAVVSVRDDVAVAEYLARPENASPSQGGFSGVSAAYHGSDDDDDDEYRFDSDGYDEDGYNEDGFDRDGYNSDGFDEDGRDSDGFDEDGYDGDGYDRDGYDREGYNSEGYDADGYDRDGFDEDGEDRDGYDEDGFNQDGRNRDGVDRDGYDRAGFNEDGVNRAGYDRYGHRPGGE